MPAPSPTLETERLILRPPIAQDWEPWAAFCADEDVMRYLGGVRVRAEAWRNIATVSGSWAINGFGMFSVVEKSSGRWVGRLGPWQPADWPGTEVAWGLARQAWGKGYAREGATAAIDWAFANLGWDEVIHTIDVANESSRALAARLGSRILRQAVLPPPMSLPVDVWGQSRAEWLARRAAG